MKTCNYVLCCLLVVCISTILFETSVFATTVSVVITPNDSGTVTTDVGGIDCGYLSAAKCITNLTALSNVMATAVPAPGYVFVEWLYSTLPADPTNPKTFIVPTINVAVTAKFAPRPPILTITPVPVNGTLTSSPAGINCGAAGTGACSASFTAGSAITLTATPVVGYGADYLVFGASKLTSTRNQPVLSSTSTMSASDLTATAAFYSDAGVCGSADTTTVSVQPATAAELCSYGVPTTVSGTGPWTWYCQGHFAGSATYMCTANVSAYQLTINKAGTGSGTVTGPNMSCGTVCSASFTQGTSVTLSALATSGTFTGWSGAGITCPGTGTCTVSMNAAAAVTATFTVAVNTPGTCGSAAGTPTSTIPAANLCGPNSTVAAPVSGYGPWTWTCNSTNGGTPSGTCTAPLATPQVYVQLPRTGQNTCYSYTKTNVPPSPTSYDTICAGTGQDGETQKGAPWPATRFTENKKADNVTSNGTVTDNLTGLVWMQQAGCITAQSWQSAQSVANSTVDGSCGLADGSTTAGTWRLPSINELNSLVDLQQSAPTFPLGSPFTGLLYNYQYWSSTSSADGLSAWIVSFQSGSLSTNSKTQTGARVWLVKGDSIKILKTEPNGTALAGVAWDNSRFVKDQAAGTITDTVTGLVWLLNANCTDTLNGVVKSGVDGGMLWFDKSLAWAAGLSNGSCGLNDGSALGQWRIPNRNELLSLVNYAAAKGPSSVGNEAWLASLGFSAVQTGNFYRTSDTSLITPTNTWRVDLRGGDSTYRDKELLEWVLPVRDGNFLSVNILGTGSGMVNSATPGLNPAITCPGGTCRSIYAPGSTIDLTPSSSWYSQFIGWIGCDTVTGPNNVCGVTMNQSRVATAVFDEFLSVGLYDTADPNNKLTSGYASRIQPSYDYLAGKSVLNGSILTLPLPLTLQDGTVQDGYYENLIFSSPINLTITGGWDGSWPGPIFAGFSTVHGSLRINNGKLTPMNLKIKP